MSRPRASAREAEQARLSPVTDRLVARLLRTRWLMRLPIPMFRRGFGWMLGQRFVMIEHLGRTSGRPRYVVVEVVSRERNLLRVASGFGTASQWYRNISANGVAFLSTGTARRVPAHARILAPAESAAVLARYAREHPSAWRHLERAMDDLAGGEAAIPVIEFTPPERKA
ncbi:MAG: nitroreductase family deazaflavin-dependent oxidoreductase [Microbacterium sp.]|uniref:nitroreductase family deazaflavin-dependent oxidoreductase n=1 Tax=Microbacterium TaxID=33882 RepID=UPI0009F64451|nr:MULTISPECIES: nitroreductase family deazaflavin-dependent oxidoreductase [Microbacterium]MAM54983.1 nitroreductase family deazaflavin-dependent oxidoreductase [Microbacterium sp.]MAY50078.1 nitroreductase family deazaflavin-dependent oxidoreductase [Microbacterium sp.]HBR88698.1 nitroreductase family deazaflavin-dependent oxidoreductase [Microbacterium sp.]HBS73344.1 nitroreductase family deazaflavin-dependent oxidoreductase [Microbacterium sp.]|tara:strand:- start:127079 stop:127588 length:510 start_codon:yes stop_codon:yes gene_type:complete